MSKLSRRLMIMSTVLLTIAAVTAAAAAPASAVAPGGRNTAVIMFNYANDTSQPVTAATLRQWMFTNTDSVNAWLREDSGNTVWLKGRNNTNGDFFGWVTINANKAPDPAQGCITSAQVDAWRAAARQRASTLGYVQANYAHTVFVQPGFTNICGTTYRGFGEWWSGDVFFNPLSASDWRGDMFGPVMMHEFSHTLSPGNHHAHKINCTYMGYGVPLDDSSCTTIGNGDWFSTLGNNNFYTLNNGYHSARLGYIPAANVRTVSAAATTTVTLRQVHPNVSGATQLIKIDRGASASANFRYLYLDFRQRGGVFENHLPTSATNGVFARVARDHATVAPENSFTYLIDATPWTTASNAWDDSIKVGDPLYDRVGNLSVTVNSVSASSASVTIAPGAPASQATVSKSGNQLRVIAAAGKRNIIGTTYDAAAGQLNIRSPYATGGRLTAGAGCSQITQIHVRCPSAGITRQYYSLGDRDDQLTAIPAFPAEIYGGDGNDTLNGSTTADTIIGGEGDDTLNAGSGNDTVRPGRGSDAVNGGAGTDLGDYSDRTDNLYLVADGVNSSGNSSISERDIIGADIENLTGGSGNDYLIGNSGNNVLRGLGGADTFDGKTGIDAATYDERTTAVWASINGTADDGALFEADNVMTTVENLIGGSGDDILYGSENIANQIVGGPGVDALYGLSGNDTLSSRDALNDGTLDCGSGSDALFADLAPLDGIVLGCETIDRR